MRRPARAYISTMPRPYPISIKVDGRTCKAEWLLLQGCRVYVRSVWGNDTVDAGDAKLQEVAEHTLERLVRAADKKRADWWAHQEREMAKLRNVSRKPRKTNTSRGHVKAPADGDTRNP